MTCLVKHNHSYQMCKMVLVVMAYYYIASKNYTESLGVCALCDSSTPLSLSLSLFVAYEIYLKLSCLCQLLALGQFLSPGDMQKCLDLLYMNNKGTTHTL